MLSRRKIKTGMVGHSIVECPVDLDALIMSENCSPGWIELNLNVSEDILYDAIRCSMFGNWLLDIDFISGFSHGFRKRLFRNMDAFDQMSKMYFLIKAATLDDKSLSNEIECVYLDEGASCMNVEKLFNPMTMLGNSMKEYDNEMLKGNITMRQVLLKCIQKFLATGNKDDVDFSYSVYLPLFLNPRFFSTLSEAEHVSILGNLDRYFAFIAKFEKSIMFGRVKRSGEINPALCLVKHILSGEFPYSNRVKMSAWKQLHKETLARQKGFSAIGLFDVPKSVEVVRRIEGEVILKSGHTLDEVNDWIQKSEGLFESFELDCTLRNLDATDFFLYLLWQKPEMANGLVDFQDDATRNRLFRQLSGVIVPAKTTTEWKLNKTLVNSINATTNEGNSE